MKILFKQASELQEKLIIEIIKKLRVKLKAPDVYKDRVEVENIHCYDEFQSDCDGDDSHIYCRVKLELKSKAAQEAILKLFKKEEHNCFDIRLKSKGDVLWGDSYTFQYKLYI